MYGSSSRRYTVQQIKSRKTVMLEGSEGERKWPSRPGSSGAFFQDQGHPMRSLMIMTYNVKSCRGPDHSYSCLYTAGIIYRFSPDVVALQEIDAGLYRSGVEDQARSIAEHLGMHHYFHPSRNMDGGAYGNAVLSRFPIQVVKTGLLEPREGRKRRERRGALWVRIKAAECTLQLINTHLSLNRVERLLQVRELTGPRWLGSPACVSPVVLCGDLNASPRSLTVRLISERLREATSDGRKRTWPSRFPLRKIDNIFVTPDLHVEESMVPRDGEVRRTSDHLPVLARVLLKP
jgi:endonuclease/exonuclease/phosphatase family metal-dependent hydrolase